ncbi:MAG TPA: DUF2628 domain-containing protein [Pseudolabrys sp.]
MPTFTVHEPPLKDESASTPERFVFVRDGFYFWAFLLAPIWLAVHRLWLILFCYLVITIGAAVAMNLLGVPSGVKYLVTFLIALLMGFEGPSLWRWNLTRRKWKTLGFVVGEDAEMAERRFYAQWADQQTEVAPLPVPHVTPPPPAYSTPVRRGPPSGSDVIGLFPEPGQQR